MNDFDILFDKIKQLSKAVTESNYSYYTVSRRMIC